MKLVKNTLMLALSMYPIPIVSMRKQARDIPPLVLPSMRSKQRPFIPRLILPIERNQKKPLEVGIRVPCDREKAREIVNGMHLQIFTHHKDTYLSLLPVALLKYITELRFYTPLTPRS